jgi:hypothetical protein
MSDIAITLPVALSARSLRRATYIAAILAVALVAALGLIRTEECRVVPGAFSSGFSLGFDVSRRVCSQSALATVVAHKVAGVVQARERNDVPATMRLGEVALHRYGQPDF